MFPWTPDLPMSIVSISDADKKNGSPKAGDMIAVNPNDPADSWLVAEKYFEDNYVKKESQIAYLKYSKALSDDLEREHKLLTNYLESGSFECRALRSEQLSTLLNAHLTLISDEISSREALIKLILSGKHKKGSTND